MYIYIHIYIYSHIHILICIYIKIDMYIHLHVYLHVYQHIYRCMYIHIYIHTYTYKCIHVYTYIYTYICRYINIPYQALSRWSRVKARVRLLPYPTPPQKRFKEKKASTPHFATSILYSITYPLLLFLPNSFSNIIT